MRNIRIGKTIELHWKITTNGKEVALAGRDLTITLTTPSGTQTNITDYIIKDVCELVFTLQGTTLTELGTYRLDAVENKGKERQTTLDSDVFTLVSRTKYETADNTSEGLDAESVDLDTSDLNLVTGRNGGGSIVVVNPIVTSGTKIATISVDEDESELYAPTPPTKTSELTNDGENGTDKYAEASEVAKKQDKLTFDSTPTLKSTNPVTSDGIKTALNKKQDHLSVEIPSDGSIIINYDDSIMLQAYNGDDSTTINVQGQKKGIDIDTQYGVRINDEEIWTTEYLKMIDLWELKGEKGEIDSTMPFFLRAKMAKDETILTSYHTAQAYNVRFDCFYHDPVGTQGHGQFYSLINQFEGYLIGYVDAINGSLYDASLTAVKSLLNLDYDYWLDACRKVFNEDVNDKISELSTTKEDKPTEESVAGFPYTIEDNKIYDVTNVVYTIDFREITMPTDKFSAQVNFVIGTDGLTIVSNSTKWMDGEQPEIDAPSEGTKNCILLIIDGICTIKTYAEVTTNS